LRVPKNDSLLLEVLLLICFGLGRSESIIFLDNNFSVRCICRYDLII
jgi:hypothetical protein